MDIWQHVKQIGEETHPDKPQYVRGVRVFTCPYCGHQLSSASFLNIGYFQIAARAHVQSLACALAQGHKELSTPANDDSAEEIPF